LQFSRLRRLRILVNAADWQSARGVNIALLLRFADSTNWMCPGMECSQMRRYGLPNRSIPVRAARNQRASSAGSTFSGEAAACWPHSKSTNHGPMGGLFTAALLTEQVARKAKTPNSQARTKLRTMMLHVLTPSSNT
jgi:hypothetical protein